MGGFFQVDRRVFTSSVWLAGTAEEKVLWVWLLGNKDDDGVVRFRELAIAWGTGLSRDVVDAALKKFSEPDPDSGTQTNEGRRIERTPEGYVRILNHELYYSKDYSTPRWRRWHDRKKGLKPSNKRHQTVSNAKPTVSNAPTPLATKDKDKDKDITKDVGSSSLIPVSIHHGEESLHCAAEAAPIRNETEACRMVFDYWRERTHHERAAWTEERRRHLTNRLREEPGSLQQKVAGLKLAVDGALLSPLFNGTEKGKAYLEFENLFIHKGRNRIETLQNVARGGDLPMEGAVQPPRMDDLEAQNRRAAAAAVQQINAIKKLKEIN